MIKGTRMIVITKNKILASAGLILLLIACVITVKILESRENITAFSDYENIIDSEITPARENDNGFAENIMEAAKSASELSDKILKHFFVLGDYEKPESTQIPQTPEPSSEPLIQSESRKVDKGMKISNATSFNINPEEFINKPLCFNIDSSGPQVLIMHTHTTESYSEESYVKGAPDRNLDETKNIVAVGKAAAEILNKNGIETIHDTTVHDYPSYNGAYQRAAATISANLKKYSSIKVVLDIHRDGITLDDGTKVKLVTDIDGVPTAQVMLVVGTNATLQHDNWQENFKFASKIQAKAIEMYPSLVRPIDVRQERFNEQLTNGSLIVEIGTNGNTLEEAVRAGNNIAEVISAVLKQ